MNRIVSNVVAAPVVLMALVALALGFTIEAAPAAPPDDCKICRVSRDACVKNHSREACRTEYDICMKHCRRR